MKIRAAISLLFCAIFFAHSVISDVGGMATPSAIPVISFDSDTPLGENSLLSDLQTMKLQRQLGDGLIFLPDQVPQDNQERVAKLFEELKVLCPHCAQLPVIPTVLPGSQMSGAGFSGIPVYVPKCVEAKVFDTELGDCVKENGVVDATMNSVTVDRECESPSWLSDQIGVLEKVAISRSVDIAGLNKGCEKQYILTLLKKVNNSIEG